MSHELYAAFSKRLIQLCDEMHLPERGRQAELARMCGVKPSSVNKWFHAVSLPDALNLVTIAEWGKTTVDWLLTGKPSITSYSSDPRLSRALKVMQEMPDYKVDQALRILDTFVDPAPHQSVEKQNNIASHVRKLKEVSDAMRPQQNPASELSQHDKPPTRQ